MSRGIVVRMTDDAWGREHPIANAARTLGKSHSLCAPLSRVQFFDALGIGAREYPDGYSSAALYYMYLDARHSTDYSV